MKLLRFGPAGLEKPGFLDPAGSIRDLSGELDDIGGDALSPSGLERLAALDPEDLPLVEGSPRLGPPVAAVGKILGIGRNYRAHAEETGATVPSQPMVFSKAVSALSGPNDPIVIPRDSEKTDWEVELALVIGSPARYVGEADALEYVAGYAVLNDVSERAFQKEMGGQFVKGKSADSFAPLGPWLVTRDEIQDPQDLGLWLDLNGERRQEARTGDMIFGAAFLVSYLSRFMALLPGDVIATGTPSGVGLGCDPPRFLRPGDLLELGVEGLGAQRLEVVAWREAC